MSRVASIAAYVLAAVTLLLGVTSFIGEIALASIGLAAILVYAGYRLGRRSEEQARTERQANAMSEQSQTGSYPISR